MIEFNITLPPINLWTTNRLRPKKEHMSVKLYTSPTCTVCGPIKLELVKAGIEFVERNVSDPEAREELFNIGVRAVPYLVAENAYGSEYKALGNGINIKSLKEMLNA